MDIKLEKVTFEEFWEGDGLRAGDNIRSRKWAGQRVTITMEGSEDKFLAAAIAEFPSEQGTKVTAEEIETAVFGRAEHLRWCSEWSMFYHIDQGGWYVGVDYATDDRPEVYDDGGNFIGFLPSEIAPGDFTALRPLVDEMWEDCE